MPVLYGIYRMTKETLELIFRKLCLRYKETLELRAKISKRYKETLAVI